MYGKYTITVGRDGKVFVFPSLSHNYEEGDIYHVLINKTLMKPMVYICLRGLMMKSTRKKNSSRHIKYLLINN